MKFLKKWNQLDGNWYYYINEYGDVYSLKLGMLVEKRIDENGDVYEFLYDNDERLDEFKKYINDFNKHIEKFFK